MEKPFREPSLRPFLARTKDTCGGQLRVSGTRLTVSHVLNSLVIHGSTDKVLEQYPNLMIDQIEACLNYASELIFRAEKARLKRGKPNVKSR